MSVARNDAGRSLGGGAIVGAAIMSHAPQLLSKPPTEDPGQVEKITAAIAEVGKRLRALQPDLVIVVSNCHAEELVVHNVPAFLIHCGDRAEGREGHTGSWAIDGVAGTALLNEMLHEGFDPSFSFDMHVGSAFTIPYAFAGFDRTTPFLPIYINAYVPPQPLPERCFAFGKALSRAVTRMGRRTVLIVSGGLSHYPATPMYPNPDLETDQEIFARIAAGNLNYIMSFDPVRLDRSGNIECRSLQLLAGAIGDRKPDYAEFVPTWHHIHTIVGYSDLSPLPEYVPLYPSLKTAHTQLAKAIYALVSQPSAAARFKQNREKYAADYDLTADQRDGLVRLDEDELREKFSINPMMTFQAKMLVGDRPPF